MQAALLLVLSALERWHVKNMQKLCELAFKLYDHGDTSMSTMEQALEEFCKFADSRKTSCRIVRKLCCKLVRKAIGCFLMS